MRARKFHLDLFETTYYICADWDKSRFEKWYYRRYDSDPDIQTEGGATFMEGNDIIVWTESSSIQLLHHECVHAANYTLDSIGHKADFKNDEVQAYLIDWVFSKAKGSK